MTRRVVVTGMGAVTPVGNSVDEAWENLKAGKSGVAPITRFDTSDLVSDIKPSLSILKSFGQSENCCFN